MSCNNPNHSYKCNCDKTGVIIPITPDLNQCICYDNMYALPLVDKDMEDEFRGYVERAGGLENACVKYPYVPPFLDRYGALYTADSNFSCYTNNFHIWYNKLYQKRRKEALEKQHSCNPLSREIYSNGLIYNAPVEEETKINKTENGVANFSNLYDLGEIKKETPVAVDFKNIGKEIPAYKYTFDAEDVIDKCNNPKKGKNTYLKYHPNDPRIEQENRNFINRPTNYWPSNPVQVPMWNTTQCQFPSWDIALGQIPGNNNSRMQQFSINPALAMEQQALQEQTTPTVTVGGRNITNQVLGGYQNNNSLFSNDDYSRAENRINQVVNNENFMAENEFPSEDDACFTPQETRVFNPYRPGKTMLVPNRQQYQVNNGLEYNSFFTDEIGLPTRYVAQRNNSWMIPSKEDIIKGKAPLARLVRTKEEKEKFIKDTKTFTSYKKPTVNSDEMNIKVAFVKEHKNEDGLVWHEYIGGDKSIIITKEKAMAKKAFEEYKHGSVATAAKKQADDTYTLVKELRRYNQELADNLLWYQNNVDFEEFIQMKRECQNQLIEYRNNDPVSSAKSSVIIAGDNTLVKDPRTLTDKQLKDMRNNFKPQKDEKGEIIENDIKKYSMDYIKFQTQDNTIFDNISIDKKIEKLKDINNLKVIPLDKDKAYTKMNTAIKNLSPVKVTQKDRYVLWKKLLRGARVLNKQSLDNFDKEFDEWWNKPRIKNQDDFNEKYLDRLHALHYEHLVLMDRMQPTEEQIKNSTENTIAHQWNDFDQGTSKENSSTYQFMKNLGFLETRMIEQDIQKQRHQLRRRYDPVAYKNLARQYSAKQNYIDGKGYVSTVDLMNQKEYNRKRQLFIDQIFKKANRGTIT